jgi:hypothetical protein
MFAVQMIQGVLHHLGCDVIGGWLQLTGSPERRNIPARLQEDRAVATDRAIIKILSTIKRELTMQFKKSLWAGLALLSAALWAPQANAIPAFARQVGMACSACHYQHFPVLNSFGRAFKEGGYTMIGAQEKVEDTTAPGVSIPAVLNAAFVGYVGYGKTNGPATTDFATTGTKSSNDGALGIPQQVSLFFAGRVGEHMGFESEVNITPGSGGTIPDATTGLIRFKVPFVYDVGNVKAGIVPFSTGLGPADSFEVLNTGAVAVHAFNQVDMAAVSAQQYIGTATAANGIAFIASNDNFFANFAKWGASQGAGSSGGPSSNYLRGAWTTGLIGLIPGFDSAIGFQVWNGTSGLDSTGSATPVGVLGSPWVETKASAVDAQMMGDVGGLPLLVVASYAKAPASTTINSNLFNSNQFDRSSFNIGAELGVIPNVATLQLAMRQAKSGVANASGSNSSDNAIMFGATYNLALNVRLELTYSKYSGDMYDAASAAAQGAGYTGDQMTMLDLAFGF